MINKIRQFLGLEYYTSNLDQFLAELNQKYRKHSPSQQVEVNKYQRINSMRDKSVAESQKQPVWDKF